MTGLFHNPDKAPLKESKPFKIKKASLAICKKYFYYVEEQLR
jgi:hypothetical protein